MRSNAPLAESYAYEQFHTRRPKQLFTPFALPGSERADVGLFSGATTCEERARVGCGSSGASPGLAQWGPVCFSLRDRPLNMGSRARSSALLNERALSPPKIPLRIVCERCHERWVMWSPAMREGGPPPLEGGAPLLGVAYEVRRLFEWKGNIGSRNVGDSVGCLGTDGADWLLRGLRLNPLRSVEPCGA